MLELPEMESPVAAVLRKARQDLASGGHNWCDTSASRLQMFWDATRPSVASSNENHQEESGVQTLHSNRVSSNFDRGLRVVGAESDGSAAVGGKLSFQSHCLRYNSGLGYLMSSRRIRRKKRARVARFD